MADYSEFHSGSSVQAKGGKTGRNRGAVLYLLLMALALLASFSMVMCAGNAPERDKIPQFNIELPENFQMPEPLEIPEFPELPGLPEMPDELRETLEGYAQP